MSMRAQRSQRVREDGGRSKVIQTNEGRRFEPVWKNDEICQKWLEFGNSSG